MLIYFFVMTFYALEVFNVFPFSDQVEYLVNVLAHGQLQGCTCND